MTYRSGLLLCLALISSGLGCATLGPDRQTTEATASTPTYELLVQGGFSGPRRSVQPLRQGLTVQNVMEDSGQGSRGNFEIDIFRATNTGAGTVKMPVQFDPGKHCVKPESDYAIHPNDRVSIRPKTYSALDNLSKALSGQQ